MSARLVTTAPRRGALHDLFETVIGAGQCRAAFAIQVLK
jgi:hypothetical protein